MLGMFENEDNEENRETILAFKRLFMTDDGKIVLPVILDKLKFMNYAETEGDMALNNFAKDLLATIYWNEPLKTVNTWRLLDYIKNLFNKKDAKNE